MEPIKLQVSSGLKEFEINEGCVISFNPTDMLYFEKLYKAFEELDGLNIECGEKLQAIKNDGEFFDAVRDYDRRMRDTLGQAFEGRDICKEAFGDVCLFTFGDGLPIWANLLLALFDQFENSFEKEQAVTNSRIQKYVKKYQK